MRTLCLMLVCFLLLSTAFARAEDSDSNTLTPATPNFNGVPLKSAPAAADPMAKALQLFNQMSPSMQKSLLGESEYAVGYCQTNSMLSQFYDCSCFSLHMLAERINRGPDVPFINLVGTAQYQQCASAPQIAGYGEDRCEKVLRGTDVAEAPLKAVCACTGRALSKRFMASGTSDINVADQEFDDALISCREENGF